MREREGVLFYLCLLTWIRICGGDCHFPQYLQSPGNSYSWIINYSDETVNIEVHANVIKQKSCELIGNRKQCTEIRRYCEFSYGEDRFMVKEFIRESSWNPELFRCIQFLKRSPRVVQIKQSNSLKQRFVSACDDSMLHLDQHPMISVHPSDEVQACPINGGFDFQLYLDGSSGPACDNVFLPLRVESDCTHREGMNFYFRRRDCLEEIIGTKFYEDPIKVKCVGTWYHRHYKFSIVKWSGTPDYWCIRVTFREDGEPEEVVMFFKSICASGNSYFSRKATLKHLDRHFVQNICEDEVLICKYHDLCSDHKDKCKLTCSVCTPERVEQSCVLPRVFQGKWNSLRDPIKYAVVISNSTFTHMDTSELEEEGVIKLDWQCVQSTEDEKSYRKRVLKIKFNNGCYPRYTCIDMELPAHSVMRFRTGSELTWPIESVSQVCEERFFDYKPRVNETSYLARIAIPWLYFIHDSPQYVSCNLPWYIPKVSVFTRYHKSKTTGTGCLITGTGSQNYYFSLAYTYKNAQNQLKAGLSTTFVCLASIRAIGENDLLISQDVTSGKFTCWIFIEHRLGNSIYVFEAEDCGHGTSPQLIQSYIHNAIATYVINKNSTDCNFIVQDAKNAMTRRSDEELSNLTVDSGSSTNINLCILPFTLSILMYYISNI